MSLGKSTHEESNQTAESGANLWVTLTLAPKYYDRSAHMQCGMLHESYNDIFREPGLLYRKFKSSAVLEFTQDGNAHIHAIMSFNKDAKFYENEKLRMTEFGMGRYFRLLIKEKITCFGKNLKVEYLRNYPKVIEYMKKDIKMTENISGYDSPIICDDFHCLYSHNEIA